MALGQVIIVGAPWTLRQGVRQTLKQLGLVIVGEGDTLDEASAKMPDAIEPSSYPAACWATRCSL